MSPSIERFFLQLPDAKRLVAMEARELILEAQPELLENIKWGQLTFSKGRKNIAFIYAYPDAACMNLGFFKATLLADPDKMFEGTGKLMRHVKLYPGNAFPSAQIQDWVRQAAAL